MAGLMPHASVVEWAFFALAIASFVYAIEMRRQACLDEQARSGNGGIEILSHAAIERTTTMVIALGFFLMAGIVSLIMSPPDDTGAIVLSDQAVVFLLLIMGGVAVLVYKLRREKLNRQRYTAYLSRTDKRWNDGPPGPRPAA